MSSYRVVKDLRNKGEDYEWYPTTNEILMDLHNDIRHNKLGYHGKPEHQSITLLDIGAGNCKLFDTFNDLSDKSQERNDTLSINRYMAIEKSQHLINLMPSEVFIVGTDFHENTLIDKKADVVFCNPPYKEFALWSERIIAEANAKYVYLVIPRRWGNNKGVANALKKRNAKVKIVGNYSFENSEDRKARAYVQLVKVTLNQKRVHGELFDLGEKESDPFDTWFNDAFKLKTDEVTKEEELTEWEQKKSKQKALKDEIVNAPDLVGALVELYNKEMEHLFSNYAKVCELDADLLKELNISLKGLIEGLKTKIGGLKYKYWQEIFDNLSEITTRLTRKSRDNLLGTLTNSTHVDFNASNIRSIVIWAIKNANKYYDQQMIDVYDEFTYSDNVHLYKSNAHWTHDSWRYKYAMQENNIKWSLDYRIVREGFISDYDAKYRDGISDEQKGAIEDLKVIARNLGFNLNRSNIKSDSIERGKKYFLYLSSGDTIYKKGTKTIYGKIDEVFIHTGTPNENSERVMEKDGITYVYDVKNKKNEVQYRVGENYYWQEFMLLPNHTLTSIKGFKNGNVHFQFNQEFIKKWNLEVGRLRKWFANPQEASEEFDISIEEAQNYWNSSFQMLPSKMTKLLPQHMEKNKEAEQINQDAIIDGTKITNVQEMTELQEKQIEAAKAGGDLLALMSV
jgi:hypothetical protein